MSPIFYSDVKNRPDLFHFFGRISPAKLDNWLTERRLTIPDDLRQLWCETGGVDLFESETVLGPFGQVGLADDVDSVNDFHWSRAMPSDWIIFHTGLGGLSIVDLQSGEYASVQNDTYKRHEQFASLDAWYNEFIRVEYATRYGL